MSDSVEIKTVYAPSSVLDDDQKVAVQNFLQTELAEVLEGAERKTFFDRIDEIRRLRVGIPESETKSYPWQKASNVVVPLMAQKVNTITSKLTAAFATKRPFWRTETEDYNFKNSADAWTRVMNYQTEGPFHINLDRQNRDAFYDLVSLGTQVMKTMWLYEEQQYKTSNMVDGSQNVKMVKHNGPAVIPLQLEDFLFRTYWNDIQRMPWCAQRTWLSWAELKQRETIGIYENVEQVEAFYMSELPAERKDELQRQGLSPSTFGNFPQTRIYPIYEVYMYWDADGDGTPEDIIVWFELGSGTILRSENNTLGARPFTALRYFKLPGEFYGRGVGHAVRDLQAEVDFLHNYRIDNLHMSLTPITVVRRGALNAKEELHPGKILPLDNPESDMRPYVVPDLTGSSYNAEMLARDYADRVTGANDPMSGFADTTMKSGADASSMMFLAQQGNSILNAILDSIEEEYSEIGQLITMQLIANKDKLDISMFSQEDQVLIQQILNTPLSDLPTLFKFRVETVDVARNEESKRNSIMASIQLYTMYGQQTMPLMQAIAGGQLPPEMMEYALRLMVGSTKLTEKALETLDVISPAELLPSTDIMEQKLLMIKQQQEVMLGQLKAINASGGMPPMAADVGGLTPGAGVPPQGAPVEGGGGPGVTPSVPGGNGY